MLTALKIASEERLRQASLLLQNIKQIDASRDTEKDEFLRVSKGMLFVALYACIEHALTNSVSTFLSYIQASPYPPLQYNPSLLPTILNREFNSVVGSSKKAIWQSKSSLIARIFSAVPGTIDNDIFPAEGTNISYDHFLNIWAQLGLPGPALPDGINHWLINEIKEHRNSIAHGREKAANIGARFSVPTLESKYRSVEAVCANTIMCFEDHIRQRTYLAAR